MNIPSCLSDYYGLELVIGYELELVSKSHNERPIFKFLYEYEGDCSTSHCSYCAGWLIENVPDCYLMTEHSMDVLNGDARNYYYNDSRNNIYHENEANEILNNLIKDGFEINY